MLLKSPGLRSSRSVCLNVALKELVEGSNGGEELLERKPMRAIEFLLLLVRQGNRVGHEEVAHQVGCLEANPGIGVEEKSS